MGVKVTDLQSRLEVDHTPVLIVTKDVLHIFDDIIRGAGKGTPASGKNRDQFNLIARKMVDELHG